MPVSSAIVLSGKLVVLDDDAEEEAAVDGPAEIVKIYFIFRNCQNLLDFFKLSKFT